MFSVFTGPTDGDVAVQTKPLRLQLLPQPVSVGASLFKFRIILSVIAAAMPVCFVKLVNGSPLAKQLVQRQLL